MQWILLRQSADGSRLDVAKYDSQHAAEEARVSYEYHHPEYAPYFVEARGPAPAPPGPRFVAPPLPATVQGPFVGQSQQLPPPTPSRRFKRPAVFATAGVVLIGVFALAWFVSTSSDNGEVAQDVTPIPTEIERVTPRVEPTSPSVAPPPSEAEDSSSAPPTPAPTPTPEEVTLTQSQGTLDAIQARGELNCGVSGRIAPFSTLQSNGVMIGFDADMCRAVAAAVLGDSEAVNFVALTAAERFVALQVGEVDVLMRNSTWTQSRDTDVGVDFGPTTYFDGQQLMGRASDGFTVDSEIGAIEAAVVCTVAGTTTERDISAAAARAGISITLQAFEDFDIVTDAFIAGACDVITTDGSGLVGRKMEQQPSDQDWIIFPKVPISKEPLGPIYRQDDSQFADIVNWTIFAMLIADENGINQTNVIANAADPATGEVDRLLGGQGELQSLMGLDPDAFGEVISQVGSYSDVFNRHLAPAGLTLEGSLNDLWINGGLMYPPPAR